MGLYDGYKLSNSTYISQYVGNLVPELANFSAVMQKRYNDARDTDDALVEAMGNLQHLQTEEDTTYANELKQNYLKRLSDRSERSDYENMGRRTQRDARAFSSEYVPLANRLKGMQAIQERVTQDKDIFSPEKKQQILGKIQHMNRAQRDPATGDFVRGADGKVKLGAISDWAYAKDVDKNKKLADFLDKLKAEETQSGFSTSADGKMLQSIKREVRSPQEIARLAKQMLETDPEMRAMTERDVELSTYHLSQGEFTQMAQKGNVSIYDQLKRAGNSENVIKSYAKAHGYSMQALQTKPLDALRNDYASKGRNPADADKDFVRHQVRQQIQQPHIDLVAEVLKIDNMSIDARVDPDYAARATASAMAAASGGDATPLEIVSDSAETTIDVAASHNSAVQASKISEEMKGDLQGAIGASLGLAKPDPKNSTDWYNKTGRYLNDTAAQGRLIAKLEADGNTQQAQNMTLAFKEYNRVNNQAIYARQVVDNYERQAEPEIKKLYETYKTKGFGLNGKEGGMFAQKGNLSYEDFKKELRNTEVESTVTGRYRNKASNTFINADKEQAMSIARGQYFDLMNGVAQKFGKSGQVANIAIEPTGPGFIKNQTDYIEDGVRTGIIKGRDLATGMPIADIIRNKMGASAWFSTGDKDKYISESERSDPNSDFNKAMKNLKVRVNMDVRGSNGEATATMKLPDGSIHTVTLDNISPTLPTEMSVRMLQGSQKYATRGEHQYIKQQALRGASHTVLKNINQVDMHNLRPSAKPYQLNDMYFLKVTDAGVNGVGGKQNVYTLMVKQGGVVKPTTMKPTTNLTDIQLALGLEVVRDQTVPDRE